MRSAPAFIFLLLFSHCSQKENKIIPQVQVYQTSVAPVINYDSCKNVILAAKRNHKAGWIKISVAEKEKILHPPL